MVYHGGSLNRDVAGPQVLRHFCSLRGDICTVHPVSDEIFWVLTDKANIELWRLFSQDKEIVDAKLLDVCFLEDLTDVTSCICCVEDTYGLDGTAIMKSQESLASDSLTLESLVHHKLRRASDLRQAYRAWGESDGFLKGEDAHADILTSHHKYTIGTGAGNLLLFEIFVVYDKDFNFKVRRRIIAKKRNTKISGKYRYLEMDTDSLM
jgi:hypothetical protein